MLKESITRRNATRGKAGLSPSTWWGARYAVGLFTLLPACSGLAEGELAEEDYAPQEAEDQAQGQDDVELGALEQPITGGSLTTSFASVLKLKASNRNTTCTVLKVAPFKFVTAAHCIDANEEGFITQLTLITDAAGAGGPGNEVVLQIPTGGVQIHPSFKLMNTFLQAFDYYDVATITTTTTTSPQGIPIPLSNNTPPSLPIATTVVGFGCDLRAGSTNGGKKQSAQFSINIGTDNDGGVAHHIFRSNNGGATVGCEGDSGGPALSNTDATVVGLVLSGEQFIPSEQQTTTSFLRVSNVSGWINKPHPGNDPSLFSATATNDLYFIHNKLRVLDPPTPLGLCMAAAGTSLESPVILHHCADPFGHLTGNPPAWTVTPVSASAPGRFLILNRRVRNSCLAPGNATNNSNLELQACDFNNNNQKWYFALNTSTTPPTLRIKNHATDLCVRSENNSTALGTAVEQSTCDAGAANSGASWVATR